MGLIGQQCGKVDHGMKILRVIPTMDPRWGGPCRLLRDSAPALAKQGVAVEVVCADHPCAEWLQESFPCYGKGPGRFGYSYSAAFYEWVSSNVMRFDAVIVDTLWQWHSLAARMAVERHANSRRSGSVPALFVMPHGGLDPWYQRDPSRRLKALRNTLYWWAVERRLIKVADSIIFTAEDEAIGSRTTFRGYRPQREVIVNLGIPSPAPCDVDALESFRKEWLRGSGEGGYFLYLNRVHPKKGTDWLIHAYSEAKRTGPPGVRYPALVVAGPGLETTFGQHVRSLVDTLGLQNDVVFTGMLDGEEKWAALYGCEAFVLCSHQENFGIAVVEALACDKPVIITDKVNIWREIEADGGGFVADHSRADFARLLQDWTQQKREHRRLAPRNCYEKNFGIEQHAETFASVIKSVLAARNQHMRQ